MFIVKALYCITLTVGFSISTVSASMMIKFHNKFLHAYVPIVQLDICMHAMVESLERFVQELVSCT